MRIITSALCALSLAACGGGAVDSPDSPSPSPESRRINAEIATVLRRSDMLPMTDMYAARPSVGGVTTPSSATVLTASLRVVADEHALSLCRQLIGQAQYPCPTSARSTRTRWRGTETASQSFRPQVLQRAHHDSAKRRARRVRQWFMA